MTILHFASQLITGRKSVLGTLACICLYAGAPVHAQVVWDGGGGNNNWGTALNWSTDLVPTNSTSVRLDSLAPTTISLENTNRPVDKLTFASSATNPIALTNTGSGGLISLGNGDSIDVESGSANHSIARVSTTRSSSVSVGGSAVLTDSFHIFGADLTNVNVNQFTKAGTGTLLISGVQNDGEVRGLITVDAGTLDIRGNLRVTATGSAHNHTQLLSGSGTLTNGGGTMTTVAFGRNSGRATADALDQTFSGTISGNLNFQLGNTSTVAGSQATNFTGTQTLSGNNTYIGTTTVNQGTLAVNGTTSGQGNYLVRGTTTGTTAKTGTLQGTGNIGLANAGTFVVGGTQLAGSNGVLYPGANGTDTGVLSIGTSGNNNVVNLSNGSVLRLDIGTGAQSDRLAITGNFTIATTGTTLDLLSLSGAWDGSTYTIATFTGSLTGAFQTVTGLDSGYQLNYLSNAITLSAIPEPGAGTMILAGLVILLDTRRFRKSARAI